MKQQWEERFEKAWKSIYLVGDYGQVTIDKGAAKKLLASELSQAKAERTEEIRRFLKKQGLSPCLTEKEFDE